MISADRVLKMEFGSIAVELDEERASHLIASLISALNEKDVKIKELEIERDSLKLKRKKKALKEMREFSLAEL